MKYRSPNSRRRGFTLIEIVVYVAVLGLITVVAVNTILAVNRALVEVRTTNALNATVAVALERMTRSIREAKAVQSAASVLDAHPGVLVLTSPDVPAVTEQFSVSGGAISYQRGSEPAIALTPPGIEVTNLVFRATSTAASQAVRVELTLSASSGRATTTRRFSSTAVLRNSYAE